ncbi:Rho family guanine nucleotide exchange factor ROM2 [Sugiyamaella lignohabitans]|uniref:Rho family guanine nucleotide exchange factor ROM2 n=1 Tax=Sugiyamaella lignohabitans TaxID=796027 RepID=A0A167CRN4_9ASCO|nr:Rho family guanine nucleotide exchange factor ROM2 [Sugiyamaella lignohabitans]ANB12029.1 Rho family guanine nucleotide exchange factor ROM2 [Sugiyamaella lignohabitans]
MDLLVLESADDEPVVKSSSAKLLGSNVTPATDHRKIAVSRRFIGGSGQTSPTKPGMSPTSLTSAGSASVTMLNDVDKDRDILFPFRITHAGLGANLTLYTFSTPEKARRDRELWRDAIMNAKREYSSAATTLKSEPFRLRVLADQAFGYDSSSAPQIPVHTAGTALDRAVREAESRTPVSLTRSNDSTSATSVSTLVDGGAGDGPRQVVNSLINSPVNCGVSFVYADRNEYCMLGLDYGVYLHDKRVGSVWKRCLTLTHVTQIAVIQDMNVAIILAGKTLAYYHLDVLINQATKPDTQKSTVVPKGYKLSEKNVGFFATGIMRDRILLFYKKTDGLSSVFKVLEPVREKGSQQKRSKVLFSRDETLSSTEYFRDVDKFYIPTESYGISLFKSTFAVHTTKGFELLSFDTKSTPLSLPLIAPQALQNVLRISRGFKFSSVDSFKKKIESSKPLGMFRVTSESIILCYAEFALYTDNDGNLNDRNAVFSYLSKAKKVSFQMPHLIIFGDEIIEVRRVDRSGQLRQVITGKHIRCIDSRDGQIKAAMVHPLIRTKQLVVELVENEFAVMDDTSTLSGY